MDAITRMGCCVRLRTGLGPTPAEVHHLKSGGRKVGDLETIPLCYDHHRSHRRDAIAVSRHPWKAEFIRRYGSEESLLAWTREQLGVTA